MRASSIFLIALGILMLLAGVSSAFAAEDVVPKPWQTDLTVAIGPVAEATNIFHDYFLFPMMVGICAFVLALMAYIFWRFRADRNPTPSKVTHNTTLEVVWTVIPVIILAILAVPSVRLINTQDTIPEDIGLTLKVTGHQWYWNYEYPDHAIKFDSNMKLESDLAPGEPRLLAVDNPVVVPVGTNVRVILTAADVIHNWGIQALEIKMDTVPGRINETWFRIPEKFEGSTIYGRCYELCGINHGYMPVAIKAVSQEDFQAWLGEAKEKFAMDKPLKPATPELADNSAVNE